jgi:hypothetical protein
MAIDLDPDHISIAQEFERVNPAARVEIKAQILRARHGGHHSPLDIAQRKQPAGAHLGEHLLPLTALKIGARGGVHAEKRGRNGQDQAIRHGRCCSGGALNSQ